MDMTAAERVRTATGMGESDRAESMARRMDATATQMTGISMFHMLTVASILASIALFLTGRKMEGIFVGLWPPTFQALKAAAERK